MRVKTGVLIVVLGLSVLLAPLVAEAQLERQIPRIGALCPTVCSGPLYETFLRGLQELGYVDGQNIVMEWRAAEGRYGRLAELASELVQRGVDLIVAPSQPAIRAAKQATTTIPIVMVDVGDPVRAGFVSSLARPGGNITGVTVLAIELTQKLLELLTAAVPGMTRVAVLGTPAALQYHGSALENAVRSLRLELQPLPVQVPAEFGRAFDTARSEGAGAVLVLPLHTFAAHQRQLAELALESRLPAIFWQKSCAELGGLIAYGASLSYMGQRVAALTGKILRGARPDDLPVERAMQFELVINLQTAQALGLTIPPLVLFQADEVIR